MVVVPEELKGITRGCSPHARISSLCSQRGGNYERVTEGTIASIENVIKNQVQADSKDKREVILCKPPQAKAYALK